MKHILLKLLFIFAICGHLDASTPANAIGQTAAGITHFDGTATFVGITDGATGTILQGHGTLPAYSTATYPSTAGTTGNVLTDNGTNWVSATSPSYLLTIDADTGSVTGSTIHISGGTSGLSTTGAGATMAIGGTLNASHGGSGQNTITGLLTGNGTSGYTGTAITQYNVLTAGATNLPNSVAPSGTTGVALVSNGAANQPHFSTVVVAGGGSGLTSTTAYGVLCGGTTTTGNFQNAGAGTTGQVFISQGSSSLPIFSAFSVTGDSGSMTGTALTLQASAGGNAGASVKFSASGSTMNLNMNDGNDNILIGQTSGNNTLSGSYNTGIGVSTLRQLTSGGNNVALGTSALQNLQTGIQNVAIGNSALNAATGTNECVAIGYNCLPVCTHDINVAIGAYSLQMLTTGSSNTVLGQSSTNNLITGSQNTCIGFNSGTGYTGAESNNICLGYSVAGVGGESNAIHIGNGSNSTCFITGISGVTVTGTAVLCSASGQLGTVASSKRYKENIVDMPESVSIIKLRPVKFNYKKDVKKELHYGLIAEEVAKDFEYLCHYNDEGKPESVKYHELPVLLLKEVQKLEKRIEELEKELHKKSA